MKRLIRLLPLASVLTALRGWAAPQANPTQKTLPNTATDIATTPRMVLLMRHAEKPPKAEHSPDLTPVGAERSRRIQNLFLPEASAPLPRPDFLFATHISRNSNRPVETLTPLAQALHIELNDRYSEDEGEKLATELLSGKYAGKVVVVCWHHGKLAALSAALGVENPPAWDDTVFDRIWKVEWVNHAAVMKNLPQNLMPGDSQ